MATTEESIVLLTDGAASLLSAKTATSILRYRGENVAAVLDRSRAGQTTDQAFGVGGATPIISALSEAPNATTLTIGIAPPGGRIPEDWRSILIEAAGRGMKLVSGLHDFLANDPDIVAAAEKTGAVIYDVRRNQERDLGKAAELRADCLRILTVGQDCSIGKMLTALELTKGLTARDVDAKFVATGQTGIMIEGDGCPVDCVVSDFVNGAIEKQILANQHHDVLIVEGQATISHPAYSCVSAGLLHGSAPQGMIMVYEVGRETVFGLDHVPLQPLPKLIEAYEMLAGLRMPSKVIGIAMNSRNVSEEEAAAERERMRGELGLPIADPLRHGVDELVDAIEKLRAEVTAQ